MAYKHRVLFVDDEASILKSLKRLFRKEKYELFFAEGGQNALDLIDGLGKPISLIVSDQRMPGMNGAEFLAQAKVIFPRARRILLTGYSDLDALVAAVNEGNIHRYLAKPWDDDGLVLAVRQEIEQYDLIVENLRLQALSKKQNQQLVQLNQNLEAKVAERSQEIIAKNKQLSSLNARLENNFLNTVRAFGSIIEIANPAMAGHGRRVSEMSVAICREIGLDASEVEQVEMAALLHDLGVIGLQGQAYKHFGENPPDVRKRYELHSASGQAMVQFIDNLDQVGLLIRSHHENYDGSGFPDGLSEGEIPLGSQIISASDMYDRIVHLQTRRDRLKRQIMPSVDRKDELQALKKDAETELKQQSFVKFDPAVVKAFLVVVQQKGKAVRTEREVKLVDVKAGMILSRALYCRSGRFLLPENAELIDRFVGKLKHLHYNDPVREPVYVKLTT